MNFSAVKNILKRFHIYLIAGFILVGCGGADKPFSLAGDTNEPLPEVDGSGSLDPSLDGCFVTLSGTMQMKVSANPDNNNLEILEANSFPIDPIPFKVDGGDLVVFGDRFPNIIFRTGASVQQADLKILGVPGSEARGPYNPDTGEINIPGLQLGVEIIQKDGLDALIPSNAPFNLTGVNLTTGPVTATGNLNSIDEEGQPLNSGDLSVVLVAAITLPEDFGSQSNLNDSIGGGALTARFEGTLDQVPENCDTAGGGGTPGGGPSGASSPSELSVTVGEQKKLTEIDFGSTLAIVTDLGGETILDCSEAENRGAKMVMVSIENTGDGDRKINLLRTLDTDDDQKNPLCSGSSEFVRGTVTPQGSATCETITVGGKQFTTDSCTIPSGEDNKITFPLIYMPFNFVPADGVVAEASPEASPGATPAAVPAPPTDTGALLIEFDDDKSFSVTLTGVTEPDSRDSISISKVVDGEISQKEIPNGQLLKIALSDSDPTPFTQDFVLKNASGDTWENVTLTIETENSAFTVVPPDTATLGPQADSDTPGTLQFGITFDPSGGGTSFKDSIKVSMTKAGSGAQADFEFSLEGTVGVDPILNEFKMQVDFLTAFIDNSLITAPVESLDFRDFVSQAPTPQVLEFGEPDAVEIQPVNLIPDDFDLLSSSTSQRIGALRILNAQGTTISSDGTTLVPGDDSTKCNEPNSITGSYQIGDCAYFYFNLDVGDDSQGSYDDETGSLTIPNLKVRVQNPYHGVIGGGVWGASDGNNNILDTNLDLSLTTHVLDRTALEDGTVLVPQSTGISRSQLNVSNKGATLGEDCVDEDSISSLEHPHFKCYLTSDGKYLTGRPASLREGSNVIRDVILVGVGKFNSQAVESDIPLFMSDSLMYLVIQGRLCPKDSNCTFSQ